MRTLILFASLSVASCAMNDATDFAEDQPDTVVEDVDVQASELLDCYQDATRANAAYQFTVRSAGLCSYSCVNQDTSIACTASGCNTLSGTRTGNSFSFRVFAAGGAWVGTGTCQCVAGCSWSWP